MALHLVKNKLVVLVIHFIHYKGTQNYTSKLNASGYILEGYSARRYRVSAKLDLSFKYELQ